MIFPLPIISTPHLKICAAKQRIDTREIPRPAAGVNPPKGEAIFLRPVHNIGLDIGKRYAVVLVVEENRKEATSMAKKRANGEGSIRKRKDGRWEGRYTAGHTPEGKAIYRNVLGKTQAEVVEKLRKAIDETKGLDVAKARQCPLPAKIDRKKVKKTE